jgi:two-component system NarL family response regulator
MAAIRVLIADDHVVFRLGVRSLVQGQDDMEFSAEAANGIEAVALYRQVRPDIVVMDLRMPQVNGIEAIGQLLKEFPQVRILVLSSYAVEEEMYKAMQAGARGYLLKNSSREEILTAIRVVAAGECYLDPAVATYLAERDPRHELTSRELDVVRLLIKGLINKEIARVLSMSENTVKTHIKQIFWKLDVTDRTEAVSAALRRGLSSLDNV